MGHGEPVGRLDRTEVEQRVRDELDSGAWTSAFSGRTSTRKVWRMWIIHPGADDRDGGAWIYADSQGRVRHVDFTSPTERLLRALAIVVLLVAVALLVSRIYPQEWCGTEVTASGTTRNICRDPVVTDPAIAAVGIVILAALGIFFTEISGFGLTMKRRVVEAGEKAQKSLDEIDRLEEVRAFVQETQADFTDVNVRTEDRLAELEGAVLEIQRRLGGPDDDGGSPVRGGGGPEEPGPARPGVRAGEGLGSDEVLGYAAEYNRCRRTMVAGPARSEAMEAILRKMRTALSSVSVPDSEIEQRLGAATADRGERLTAYAYLLEHPSPGLVAPLVRAASREDKPFGQYSALRAVNEVVDKSARGLDPGLTALLSDIAVSAGHGTDRAREVASILARNRGKPRNVV